MRYTITMLLLLTSLTLCLSSCVTMPRYLNSDDRIYFIPEGTIFNTTEGPVRANDTMVAGYKGHLFQDDLDADAAALKPK